MPKIKGGYYIKARIIQESEICCMPPHYREIWDWLLMNANHKDCKVRGRVIKRGQLLCSSSDVLNGLAWKVGYRLERYKITDYENTMKFLRRRGMIATTRTGRGIIVTICNYDYYQNPKNYECRNGYRNEYRPCAEPVPNHIQELKNGKNDKNDKKKEKELLELFNKFWKLYPNRKGKESARKRWLKLQPDKELFETIMQAVKAQIAWRDNALKNEFRPEWPNPATWLNQKRWEDEIENDSRSEGDYSDIPEHMQR